MRKVKDKESFRLTYASLLQICCKEDTRTARTICDVLNVRAQGIVHCTNELTLQFFFLLLLFSPLGMSRATSDVDGGILKIAEVTTTMCKGDILHVM